VAEQFSPREKKASRGNSCYGIVEGIVKYLPKINLVAFDQGSHLSENKYTDKMKKKKTDKVDKNSANEEHLNLGRRFFS
jgi:hypothetical protein